MKIFDKEMKDCTTEYDACSDACMKEGEKPDGTAYFNAGEIYPKCMKASQCHEKSSSCNEQALTNYKACGKPGKQPETTKTSKQGSNWLEFLGINPYQTWLRLKEIAEVTQFYASGDFEESLEGGFLNLFGAKSTRQKDEEAVKAKEQAFESVFGKDWQEQLNQPPKIDSKTEENAWEIPVSKEKSVTDVPGATDTKRYSWDESSGAVVKSNDWEKIKFREPVEVEGFTSHTVELGEGEIEVKVRNNNPAENQFGVDAGWLDVTVSRTHFWISQNQDKKMAVVGVYEGEVEVKTRDGQSVKVSPQNGEPEVVVVSRKLSPIKLALVGLVMAGGVGGLIWFVKRKKKR